MFSIFYAGIAIHVQMGCKKRYGHITTTENNGRRLGSIPIIK